MLSLRDKPQITTGVALRTKPRAPAEAITVEATAVRAGFELSPQYVHLIRHAVGAGLQRSHPDARASRQPLCQEGGSPRAQS